MKIAAASVRPGMQSKSCRPQGLSEGACICKPSLCRGKMSGPLPQQRWPPFKGPFSSTSYAPAHVISERWPVTSPMMREATSARLLLPPPRVPVVLPCISGAQGTFSPMPESEHRNLFTGDLHCHKGTWHVGRGYPQVPCACAVLCPPLFASHKDPTTGCLYPEISPFPALEQAAAYT